MPSTVTDETMTADDDTTYVDPYDLDPGDGVAVRDLDSEEADASTETGAEETGPELFARKGGDAPESFLLTVPLDFVRPDPDNPRTEFDEAALNSLAASIRQQGILQPISVRPVTVNHGVGDDRTHYIIIAGERRFRAAQRAGLTTLRVLVQSVEDAGDVLAKQIVENLQRVDLNPMDAAHGYQRLRDKYGYTLERIGDSVSASPEKISNTMRLLDLPVETQQLVGAVRLTPSHAMLLLPLSKRAQTFQAVQLAQEAADGEWTVKRLGTEIEQRFPRPVETPLLDVPVDAPVAPEKQSRFASPGPAPASQVLSLTPGGDSIPAASDELNANDETADFRGDDLGGDDAELLGQDADPAEPSGGASDEAEQPEDQQDAEEGSAEPEGTPEPVPVPAVATEHPAPETAANAPVGISTLAEAKTPDAKTPDAKAASAKTSTAAPATASLAPAQPAGTINHTLLVTQEMDDWLWEQDLTPLAALNALRDAWDYRLTPRAQSAAHELTDHWNQQNPDQPATLPHRVESILVVRANALTEQSAE